jgi:hypothetical protein
MGITCGPGYPLQVLAFPALNPAHAAGFTLLSLMRPAHQSIKGEKLKINDPPLIPDFRLNTSDLRVLSLVLILKL